MRAAWVRTRAELRLPEAMLSRAELRLPKAMLSIIASPVKASTQ